jgi:FMN-dependent NADH-azoreductase
MSSAESAAPEGNMTSLLLVKSSIFGANSKSSEVAEEFVRSWRAKHPDAKVVTRDLGSEPVPHLGLEHLGALMTPHDQRTPVQRESIAAADALIGEVEEADMIVIASPMYNFSISSNLKAWIDHVTRAGRTFRYTEEGRPEGLLKNKKVVVVTGRGGVYSEGALSAFDFQEPYLRTILGFIGLTNLTFVHVEGLKINADAAANGMARARAAISRLLPAARAA